MVEGEEADQMLRWLDSEGGGILAEPRLLRTMLKDGACLEFDQAVECWGPSKKK